jgi:hypothetical protein
MLASPGWLTGTAAHWLHNAPLHALTAHRTRPVKMPSAPVRSAATAGGEGGGTMVLEAVPAFGSADDGLSVAGLALADLSSSGLEIFLAPFDAFGFPAPATALAVFPDRPPDGVLPVAREAGGLAAELLDVLALAAVVFVPPALLVLALVVRALVAPAAVLAVAALPGPDAAAGPLAEPLPALAGPFPALAGPLPVFAPFAAADRVPVDLAAPEDAVVLVPAVLVPVPAALAVLDGARTARVAVAARAGVVAVVAVDMALAASVSDLTADSIALVAVLIAWSAVVMVLADEVALVAAVFSFVAAVVTFVAAAETALGVAAALDVVLVRLAGVRALVVRVAVAVVPEALVVVARAFAALVPTVLGFAVLGFAVVGRAVARFPVSVGTDLPPDLDQIQGHSFHRRDPLHIVVFT